MPNGSYKIKLLTYWEEAKFLLKDIHQCFTGPQLFHLKHHICQHLLNCLSPLISCWLLAFSFYLKHAQDHWRSGFTIKLHLFIPPPSPSELIVYIYDNICRIPVSILLSICAASICILCLNYKYQECYSSRDTYS